MSDETTTDQGDSQSVVEKIASKFGLPQEETGQSIETETDSTLPDLAEIEWDGEKFQVPGKLKDAFMKNQDYTQKTQQLADQRKQLDHVRELAEQATAERAFTESIAGEQREIAVIDSYLQQIGKIDWSQMSMEAMFRQRQEIDTVKERRDQLTKSIETKRGEFNTQLQSKIGELRTKSREMASKSISGFSDATEKEVRDFAASEGLNPREIDNVLLDPRSFKVLWKAMQYDKVQASTGKAVTAATKVVKPGAASNPMPKETVSKLNFSKAMKAAGNDSGAKARVIEDRLVGMFSKG